MRSNTALFKLNPNAKLVKETARRANEEGRKRRQDALKANRGFSKSASKDVKKARKDRKANSAKWISNYTGTINEATRLAKEEEAAWLREGIVEEEE